MRFKEFLLAEQGDMIGHTEEDKFAQWKEDVKAAHPEYAAKMKFIGRSEKGGHNIISAEVPGLDRSFGVWHVEDGSGHVLGD